MVVVVWLPWWWCTHLPINYVVVGVVMGEDGAHFARDGVRKSSPTTIRRGVRETRAKNTVGVGRVHVKVLVVSCVLGETPFLNSTHGPVRVAMPPCGRA